MVRFFTLTIGYECGVSISYDAFFSNCKHMSLLRVYNVVLSKGNEWNFFSNSVIIKLKLYNHRLLKVAKTNSNIFSIMPFSHPLLWKKCNRYQLLFMSFAVQILIA